MQRLSDIYLKAVTPLAGAVTIDVYDHVIELLGTVASLTNDTLKGILLNSSHTRDVTNTLYSEVSANELSTANGYTSGGLTLSTVTYAHTTGTVKFDSADLSWTASGAGITASDCVIYDDTLTSPADGLIIDIDLDGDQVAGAGTPFLVSPDATNGWWTGTMTGA